MTDNKALKIELGRDCVAVRPGYNGARHNDPWVKHHLAFGIVAWAYEDGELISVQIPVPTNGQLETFSYEGWLPSTFEKYK
jgi:hypothetical protein